MDARDMQDSWSNFLLLLHDTQKPAYERAFYKCFLSENQLFI